MSKSTQMMQTISVIMRKEKRKYLKECTNKADYGAIGMRKESERQSEKV